MLAPLRSVFATQFMTCNMDVDMASTMQLANGHHQHMMKATQVKISQVETSQVETSQVEMAQAK
ncbi:hypothetical protein MNBD_GAMMA06-623, partial [hydrothermal vent metagenome]